MKWKVLVPLLAVSAALIGAGKDPVTVTPAPATVPATAASRPAVIPKSVSLQIKTMDFKNVADGVMNKLLGARFLRTTSNAQGLLVRPVERALLERLRVTTASLQAHPHDIKLAILMMKDLNSATFMADVPTGNRAGTGANEKATLPFLRELRDEAASATTVMLVVNIAGSADHLLTQQAVNAEGDFAVTATTSKPTPWLNADKAVDKKWIAQLTSLRDAALEILDLEMKNEDVVDKTIVSKDVQAADGSHLEGLLGLTEGQFDKNGKLLNIKTTDSVRTLGKVDQDKLNRLLDKLSRFEKPGGRPRYIEFLNADTRLLNDNIKKVVAQPLSNETVILKVVK